MSHFPDTSFLCALYRSEVNSALADSWMKKMPGGLQVSSLLLLEFRQSVRLQTFLHASDRKKGYSKLQGEQIFKDLHYDLAGGVLTPVSVEWSQVHHLTESLSLKYTLSEGHRLLDILHVATALHLGASQFLSFDLKQRKLAKAEGLKVTW